ncbi:sensor histidine kinase [Salinimicrobium sediminilitoris]|uniref:sensor histidine kinase n=1 Tax=Salinimicrobium sediminilitoris TaxID=2876715 RepID=UPI001E4C720C|nr:ATP-binding protein [Salinimicrobium sediminilitoris]MCC8359631.1 GHKL domain-containing protein [Salinimicrobium sediminilitoris]
MIVLVLLASILIGGITVLQYKKEAQEYHRERLERKEEAIREHIKFVVESTTYEIREEMVYLILKQDDKIHEISQVHNMPINVYSLEGDLILKSNQSFFPDTTDLRLDRTIVEKLQASSRKRVIEQTIKNDKRFQSSYTYITDNKFRPLAILNLPYLEDDYFITRDLRNFLIKLTEVYLFMLVLAILLAYFLSKYITRSLKTVSERIHQTRLDKKNQKIEIGNVSEEIFTLVAAYNSMIDELEESAAKLATSEREQAWREMAKQVAHEIKNPLTPMRLSVQSFQRKFDPNDPQIQHKVDEFSDTLITQIDTMSSIASAFSNFAKMPAQQNETLNVPKIVKLALDIFNEDYILFSSEKEEIVAKFDRTQLIRVVTNLVKNAVQAVEKEENPAVLVSVMEEENRACLVVSDNGVGISEENKDKIFEPKFTTKSSGMGLGLAMVKNIVESCGGSIQFTSKLNKGTIFKVHFPK